MSRKCGLSGSSTAYWSTPATGQEWVRKPETECNPHRLSKRPVAVSALERVRVVSLVKVGKETWVHYRRSWTDDGPSGDATHRLKLLRFRQDFLPADLQTRGQPLPRSVRRSVLRARLLLRRGYPATQRTASPGGG